MKRRIFLGSISTVLATGCNLDLTAEEGVKPTPLSDNQDAESKGSKANAPANNKVVKETIFGVPILDRSEWEAEKANIARLASLRRAVKDIKYITIHHTAGAISYKKTSDKMKAAEARIKNDQSGHMRDNGWGDIAYHYMVTPAGLVYEARAPEYASDSGSWYYTKKEWQSAGQDKNGQSLFTFTNNPERKKPGASAAHLNLSFVGDYTTSPPDEAAFATMEKLAAAMLKKYDIHIENVYFHREVANTTCPGNPIYEYFRGSTRKRGAMGVGLKKIEALRNQLG